VILVAASSPASVEYLTGILCEAGYAVRVTPSACIATDSSSGPRLVILVSSSSSLQLKKICHMCSRIRTNAPKLPILIVGPDNTDVKVRLFELGADDYIVPPFDHQEFLARIKSLIRRQVGLRKED
jgi:two-component system OmpR family response regulator